MAIIAMTQHIGTKAFELGRLTAEGLGYRFLSADEIIAQAAERYHLKPAEMVIVDERRPHFWERLKTDTERVARFFRAAALKAMAADRIVIIGRSVTHMMPDCGCGLRVRLTGPFKERVRLVGAEEGLAPAIAERRVRDYDRETRARIQTLLDVDMDDPANFDLVLNTGALPMETLAHTLAGLAAKLDQSVGPDNWRRMRDAALAAEVHAALMLHPKIGHAPFDVQCAGGVVQVTGPGLVPPWDGLVNEIVQQIAGVRGVEVNADEQPIPMQPN
jgi:cytidylate kinase